MNNYYILTRGFVLTIVVNENHVQDNSKRVNKIFKIFNNFFVLKFRKKVWITLSIKLINILHKKNNKLFRQFKIFSIIICICKIIYKINVEIYHQLSIHKLKL